MSKKLIAIDEIRTKNMIKNEHELLVLDAIADFFTLNTTLWLVKL